MSSRSKENNKKKSSSGRRKGLSLGEKIAIPVIIIIAIWGVYSLTQPSPQASTPIASASTTLSQSAGAPDFQLPVVGASGLTGQQASLSSFRGKVVLLEFMEPWCPHCQNMAPVLGSLYKQFGAQNVVFVSVAGPWQGATADDTAKFVQNYGSSWTYLYDSSGSIMNVYGVTATPTFFIIGKDGSIITSLQGEQSSDTLARILTQASS